MNPAHLRLLPNFENARRVNGLDWPMGQCANGHPNNRLKAVVRVARGKKRLGTICGECRRIYAGRHNWRRRHPGEPLPERFHLANERKVK